MNRELIQSFDQWWNNTTPKQKAEDVSGVGDIKLAGRAAAAEWQLGNVGMAAVYAGGAGVQSVDLGTDLIPLLGQFKGLVKRVGKEFLTAVIKKMAERGMGREATERGLRQLDEASDEVLEKLKEVTEDDLDEMLDAAPEVCPRGDQLEGFEQILRIQRPPRHHIFPQAERTWFEQRGVDIDRYTLPLDKGTHEALHYGGGPGRGGGYWNDVIMERLRGAEQAAGRDLTPREILRVGAEMRRDAGLQNVKVVHYDAP